MDPRILPLVRSLRRSTRTHWWASTFSLEMPGTDFFQHAFGFVSKDWLDRGAIFSGEPIRMDWKQLWLSGGRTIQERKVRRHPSLRDSGQQFFLGNAFVPVEPGSVEKIMGVINSRLGRQRIVMSSEPFTLFRRWDMATFRSMLKLRYSTDAFKPDSRLQVDEQMKILGRATSTAGAGVVAVSQEYLKEWDVSCIQGGLPDLQRNFGKRGGLLELFPEFHWKSFWQSKCLSTPATLDVVRLANGLYRSRKMTCPMAWWCQEIREKLCKLRKLCPKCVVLSTGCLWLQKICGSVGPKPYDPRASDSWWIKAPAVAFGLVGHSIAAMLALSNQRSPAKAARRNARWPIQQQIAGSAEKNFGSRRPAIGSGTFKPPWKPMPNISYAKFPLFIWASFKPPWPSVSLKWTFSLLGGGLNPKCESQMGTKR